MASVSFEVAGIDEVTATGRWPRGPGRDRVRRMERETRPGEETTEFGDRADEFNALFNELETHLKRVLHIDRPYEFMNLVNEAARRGIMQRSLTGELHDFKNLRNLLVHTPRYPHEAFAEPSEWGLARFRSIVQEIAHPQRLIPTFQRDLRVFSPGQPLTDALHYMDAKDYSQVVVRGADGRHTLLSLEGVARWVARATTDGVVRVGDATIADALQHEPPGTCVYLPREATLEEAREAFELPAKGQRRPRVYAGVITEHGDATEAPLGIVTAGDLLPEQA